MKQLVQSLKDGRVSLLDVPTPAQRTSHVITQTHTSLISAGTERMLLDFGQANWMQKARQQPEKVRQVIDKINTDGLGPTYRAVKTKLDQPLPLGYCNVGRVMHVAADIQSSVDLKFNDRVVSNGPHAEIVCVPKNLVAKIPDPVSDADASFAVLAAVALQGIRLAQPTLGEVFVVTGLGMIGLLAVQLLIANGCRVIGIDVNETKCELAARFGADIVNLGGGQDPVAKALTVSQNRGIDGVIITASTTSDEPLRQAAQMCRKRGRIVLTGVTGLHLQRSDFYEKELSFQVSCAYGPGRYDPDYEEKGFDYPHGYVRWTAQRNFQAALDLMAAGKLDPQPLISHRYRFEDAESAYKLISDDTEPYLGILFEYDQAPTLPESQPHHPQPDTTVVCSTDAGSRRRAESITVGFIGAGNFAGQVLLPVLSDLGVRLKSIASIGGLSGTHLAGKFRFEHSTTDSDAILHDPEIDCVVIATRHDSHARLTLAALQAGKHVFVEKPLCLTLDELEAIKTAYAGVSNRQPTPVIMVGFNRRFSPHARKIKELLQTLPGPAAMVMTVNAGRLPADHWTRNPKAGGGRIVGEACHFIDLFRFFVGDRVVEAHKLQLDDGDGDTCTLTLSFADRSVGSIHYLANGHRRFPKERLEVFSGGRILQLDNFKRLKGYGWRNFSKMHLWRQDKGHAEEFRMFFNAVAENSPTPIPFAELAEVSAVSIRLQNK